jgi:hypothetical protein
MTHEPTLPRQTQNRPCMRRACHELARLDLANHFARSAKRALVRRAPNIPNATFAATVRSRAPNWLQAPASNAPTSPENSIGRS